MADDAAYAPNTIKQYKKLGTIAPTTQGYTVSAPSATPGSDWNLSTIYPPTLALASGGWPVGSTPTGVMCDGAGYIVGRQLNDTVDISYPVAANALYPYCFHIIRASGTTATGIVVIRTDAVRG